MIYTCGISINILIVNKLIKSDNLVQSDCAKSVYGNVKLFAIKC